VINLGQFSKVTEEKEEKGFSFKVMSDSKVTTFGCETEEERV